MPAVAAIEADIITAEADWHATKLYFMARRAGWRPAQSIAGFVSYYDMGGWYPGMSPEVYANPWKYWPYDRDR